MIWRDPREATLWARLAPTVRTAARKRAGRQIHLIPELELSAWARVGVLVARDSSCMTDSVAYFTMEIERGCDQAYREWYRWHRRMCDVQGEAEARARQRGMMTVRGEKKFLQPD